MDLPQSVSWSGLASVTVGDGSRPSISLMSSRTSFMNSSNEARSESTLPFHVPNAKAPPTTTDSMDKMATHATGLASHSFTIPLHLSPCVPDVPRHVASFGETRQMVRSSRSLTHKCRALRQRKRSCLSRRRPLKMLPNQAPAISPAALTPDSIAPSMPRLSRAKCSPQKWMRAWGLPRASAKLPIWPGRK